VTRAEVARQIAEEHGYQGEFVDVEDTGEVLDVINQSGETDARFLRRLAAREEFEFYVDDGGFHFHERRQDAAPTHVFTWFADPGRGDVLSVNVESDLVKRAGRVRCVGAIRCSGPPSRAREQRHGRPLDAERGRRGRGPGDRRDLAGDAQRDGERASDLGAHRGPPDVSRPRGSAAPSARR
jgi:hypothetical protein